MGYGAYGEIYPLSSLQLRPPSLASHFGSEHEAKNRMLKDIYIIYIYISVCVSIYCPVKPGFSIVIMFDYQMVFHFSRMQLQAGQWLLWFQATPDFMWHMNNGRPNKVGTSKSLRPSLKA